MSDCTEYSTMIATWGSTIAGWIAAFATWAAVAAAIWAGKWAKRTFEAQREALELAKEELKIAKEELADARAKDQQENQLKRFRHGPFFTVERAANTNLAVVPINGEEAHRLILTLKDQRECMLAGCTMRESGSSVTRDMTCKVTEHRDGSKTRMLRYDARVSDIENRVLIQITVWYGTADGYQDIHVYEHRLGSRRFIRVLPTLIPLTLDDDQEAALD